MREQTERLRQMLGAQYDPRQFEGPQMRRDVLDGIIQQRVLANEVVRANLTISNEKIRDTILQIPAVAALRKRMAPSIRKPTYGCCLRRT